MTDTERLDYLQALLDQAPYTGRAILRISRFGRGFRLHESGRRDAVRDIRQAIDDFKVAQDIKVPKRIQRSRAAGWKMPADAIYVGRPTKWGNPYKVIRHMGKFQVVDKTGKVYAGGMGEWMAAGIAVSKYEKWLHEEVAAGRLCLDELAGHDLACWCHPQAPCHADVLLDLANDEMSALGPDKNGHNGGA